MQISVIAILLCLFAAIYVVIAARGFASGTARTRYTVADRATNPTGFWFAQIFNLLFAALALIGAVMAVRGI